LISYANERPNRTFRYYFTIITKWVGLWYNYHAADSYLFDGADVIMGENEINRGPQPNSTSEAVILFEQLSDQAQLAIIDLAKSLSSEQ